jgi:formamidopyrimidine-DNA glycosylase
MPELPEVETIRRQLHDGMKGFYIRGVDIWQSGREGPGGSAFSKLILGRRIVAVHRRAKLLIWELSEGLDVLAHLKMTGRFVFVDTPYSPQKHDRIRFELEDSLGEKRYVVWSDVRKFGFMQAVEHAVTERVLADYGPEPLEYPSEQLAAFFVSSSKRSVKQYLLDQRFIAGVGNIYADEACFRARILPTRCIDSLTEFERLKLAENIQDVLRASLEQKGTSANDYVDAQGQKGGFLSLLKVYGREGEACEACLGPIRKIVHAQRGTHFCEYCQK